MRAFRAGGRGLGICRAPLESARGHFEHRRVHTRAIDHAVGDADVERMHRHGAVRCGRSGVARQGAACLACAVRFAVRARVAWREHRVLCGVPRRVRRLARPHSHIERAHRGVACSAARYRAALGIFAGPGAGAMPTRAARASQVSAHASERVSE